MLRPSALPALRLLLALALGATLRAAPASPAATPEPWIAKPTAEWPQMVLTHSARFRGHTGLEGASAFLLRTPAGEIVGATALHLLGANGGVEPEIRPAQLDGVLEAWSLFPRTRPREAVKVTGLGPVDLPRRGVDWLLLKIDATQLPKTIHVLTPRIRPAAPGETVYLVGVSYDEPAVAQKVYTGKVTQRGPGHRFRFDITPHVDIRGFSGAPILDKEGRVVGVTSIWFEPKMQGGLWTESGGEDAAVLLGILK